MAWGDNIQSAVGHTVSSLTLASYAVAAGDNKILAVLVGTELIGTPGINTVTHNAVGMTQRASAISTTESADTLNRIYDLAMGSTTPTGDIVATAGAAQDGFVVTAMTAAGLVQQAPEATATEVEVNVTTTSLSITTVTANAEILDGATSERNSGVYAVGATNQNLLSQAVDRCTLMVSEQTATSIGSYDMQWDDGPARSVDFTHCIAAYEVISAGSTHHVHLPLLGVG